MQGYGENTIDIQKEGELFAVPDKEKAEKPCQRHHPSVLEGVESFPNRECVRAHRPGELKVVPETAAHVTEQNPRVRHSPAAPKAHPLPEVDDRTLAALTEGETGGKSNVCPADRTVLGEEKVEETIHRLPAKTRKERMR